MTHRRCRWSIGCLLLCNWLVIPSVLVAGPPTANEQYLIELLNRDRADPVGAAARYGVDLNEGLPAGTISTAPKQPLAVNSAANGASHDFAEYLRGNNLFQHTGAGNSSPGDRLVAASYATAGTFSWGENIAYTAGTSNFSLSQIDDLERALFVDAGIANRGHRTNMLNPNYREMGSGISIGNYIPPGSLTTWKAVLLVQDFARRNDGARFTGVAYNDTSGNNFYTPGEGLGAVTIVATNQATGAQYVTNTFSSGGYAVLVPAGTYELVAFGGNLGGTVLDESVSIGSLNVKFDFHPQDVLAPGDANGDDFVDGVDYTIWADKFLTSSAYHNGTTGDFTGDGIVDGADYTRWADHFAPGLTVLAVPEPASWVLVAIGLGSSALFARGFRRRDLFG